MEIRAFNPFFGIKEQESPDQSLLHHMMTRTAQQLLKPIGLASEQAVSLEEAAFKIISMLSREQGKTPLEILSVISKDTSLDPTTVIPLYQKRYDNKDAGLEGFATCAIAMILIRKVENNAGPDLQAALASLRPSRLPQRR